MDGKYEKQKKGRERKENDKERTGNKWKEIREKKE